MLVLSKTTTKIMIHVNSITLYLRASLTPQKSITYVSQIHKQHTDISKQTQNRTTHHGRHNKFEANVGAAAADNDDIQQNSKRANNREEPKRTRLSGGSCKCVTTSQKQTYSF